MANRSGSKGLLHGRMKLLAVTAVVVAGLTAFAVWLLVGLGVFTLRGRSRCAVRYDFLPGSAVTRDWRPVRWGPADIDVVGKRMSMCRSR